ncbi:MAG: DUF5711 family protein [bacterium]|nr:DUF5711 family protein [bacterium]
MDNETVDDVIKDMVFFDDEDASDEINSGERDFAGAEPDEGRKEPETEEIDSETGLQDATGVIPVSRIMEELAKENSSQDEDISDEESFSYDYEYDEEDFGDTRLVTPMIKPLIKKLIPLLVVLLLLIWATTTDNFIVRNYRENFGRNLGSIMSSLGINLSASDEEQPEDNADGSMVEYKESEENNDEKVYKTEYRTEVESDVMITFEGAADAQFVKYREGVVCASANYLCYINKEGTVEWEKNVAVTDPILRAEGDYFLLAQRSGNRFMMYKGSSVVFDRTADNNILTGNVSANGDAVLVTDKPGYKGALEVYNRRGDKAFAWSSGNASIISADISASSRRVAAALLNTDSTVKSSVYLFNIKQSDSYAQREFDASLIYKVDFKDNDLTVFADNALIGMKHSGKEVYRIDFGDSEVTRTSLSDDSDKLVLFTGTNIPMINIYNKRGKLKNTISSQKVPDYAYIDNDNVVYNTDREIIMGKTNISIPYKYTAIMDIKGIVPVDDRSFLVIYSNSISMVCMKGMLW